jgi:hypothetical protein
MDIWGYLFSFTIFVGGALLSWIIQVTAESLTLRRNKKLFRDWKSMWRPQNESNKSHWVSETVRVSQGLGHLSLRNLNNSAGYQWKGTAKVFGSSYLYGTWRSVRPGAHSRGVISLTIGPQGNYMFGVFHGPNDEGISQIGLWALGLTEADLETAKGRLASTQH